MKTFLKSRAGPLDFTVLSDLDRLFSLSVPEEVLARATEDGFHITSRTIEVHPFYPDLPCRGYDVWYGGYLGSLENPFVASMLKPTNYPRGFSRV